MIADLDFSLINVTKILIDVSHYSRPELLSLMVAEPKPRTCMSETRNLPALHGSLDEHVNI